MRGDPLVLCADLLESMNIPYCLVGGYAVSAYGVPRETGDIDVLVLIEQEPESVLRQLKERGLEASLIKSTDLLDPVGDIITIDLGFPVQLIFAKYKYQQEAVKNAITINYEGRPLRIAAPEDLILMKLKAAGPLDLSDAEYILQSSPVKIDLELLVNKARELKVNRRLTRLLKRLGKLT